MAVLFALVSAVIYGSADYVGGRASRIRHPLNIALIGEIATVIVIGVAVVIIGAPWPSDPAIWWGALAGFCGVIGIVAFYWGLSSGAMTIVAPTTGLVGAIFPVIIGVALGDRLSPLAGIGVALAIVAVALIGKIVKALHEPVSLRVVTLSVVVGLIFGVLFVAYAQTGDNGMWPLVTARVGAFPALITLYVLARRRGHPALDRVAVIPASLVGVGGILANALYLTALRYGMLSIVAVITALYPAATVVLAIAVDREQLTRWQKLGMVVAVVSVILITLG